MFLQGLSLGSHHRSMYSIPKKSADQVVYRSGNPVEAVDSC